MSSPPSLLRVRIARKTTAAQGICLLELASEDGVTLPRFSAGSHIDVQLPNGLTRQYSLCNAVGVEDCYEICVLREPNSRGGSIAIHEQLAEGDLLSISTPKNHFPLVHAASSSILIAGGIGITPIISMADRLHQAGAAFRMHYCAKSPAHAAFHDRLARSPYASSVSFYFSATGHRADAATLLRDAPEGAHVYVCGPQGFIDAVLGAARVRGWSEDLLHREYFAAGPASGASEAFEVKLASTGELIPVQRDETVLSALCRAGIELPFSCEQGVCGTCLTRVLEGTPDHRDAYLTAAEQAGNDQFLPCCSRSKSPVLVLDL